MLRFADRMFYKVISRVVLSTVTWRILFFNIFQNYLFFFKQDWWNSTSFANYYRTWNVVVHDWLYCYVYRDFLWVSHYAFGDCLCMINKKIQYL